MLEGLLGLRRLREGTALYVRPDNLQGGVDGMRRRVGALQRLKRDAGDVTAEGCGPYLLAKNPPQHHVHGGLGEVIVVLEVPAL